MIGARIPPQRVQTMMPMAARRKPPDLEKVEKQRRLKSA
jgi:hypothetical protein